MNVLNKRNWNADAACYETLAGGCGATIRAWYDRSLQLWTATVVDVEGNQIGHASYAPNRALAEMAIDNLLKEGV